MHAIFHQPTVYVTSSNPIKFLNCDEFSSTFTSKFVIGGPKAFFCISKCMGVIL